MRPQEERLDEICIRPTPPPVSPTRPLAPAIVPTSVWICNDTAQAEQLLAGQLEGYVYQRDGHPNADSLAARCAALHHAEQAAVASSGMAALAAALLAICKAGDHVAVSRQLYGRSLRLLTAELPRLGIECSMFDAISLEQCRAAIQPRTRLVVVETIANPRLEVADIAALGSLAHESGALLLVDNTFASPILCRPLLLGADLVLESVSKIMNGHSDVMLGVLCGRSECWDRVPGVIGSWGLSSSPFDCWLAERGLATLPLRIEQACRTAQQAARWLSDQQGVTAVDYPGLEGHPQHALALRQFDGQRCGTMITFHLAGGRAAADRFLAATPIPFCPSLGEVGTSLSHPESTSHRGLSADERLALGIGGGTLRLSVGIESWEYVRDALQAGLEACG